MHQAQSLLGKQSTACSSNICMGWLQALLSSDQLECERQRHAAANTRCSAALTTALSGAVGPGIPLAAVAGVPSPWCWHVCTAAIDSVCCAVAGLALAAVGVCSRHADGTAHNDPHNQTQLVGTGWGRALSRHNMLSAGAAGFSSGTTQPNKFMNLEQQQQLSSAVHTRRLMHAAVMCAVLCGPGVTPAAVDSPYWQAMPVHAAVQPHTPAKQVPLLRPLQ